MHLTNQSQVVDFNGVGGVERVNFNFPFTRLFLYTF